MSVITGRGIIFPIELENGAPIIRDTAELIRSSIKVVLSQPLRERFFLPEFGSKLDALLEEPNDQILITLIKYSIYDALKIWEPRVQILNYDIRSAGPEKLNVFLYYRIISSKRIDSLIFPFYKTRLI